MSTPSIVNAGEFASFTVRLTNYGGLSGTKKVEAAIIPTTFWSSSLNYSPESYVSIAECCSGNTYYDAKEVTIAPLKTEDVVFTVRAPTKTSIDTCDTSSPIRSAWGSSFKYVAGVYDACGSGYTSTLETIGPTVCSKDPTCSYVDDDDCADSNTVQDWYKETVCEGGCSSWIKGSAYDCSLGQYCTDPGDASCKQCSTSCDGVCQSSACFGTDPDCASDGSIKICSGGGSCNGEITTIVRDNKGNGIYGINVQIDGVSKGTTDAIGKKTSSILDPYCGVMHIIKAYCSDGSYCGSSATQIGSNGEHDDVYFNCQVCLPLPELRLYVTAPSSYEIADAITLEMTVKDSANNAVNNAYVVVCDPFDDVGCPYVYHSEYTNADGKILHNSKASKLGAHTFRISATKDSYKLGKLDKTVTVGSLNGKILVDVKDLKGAVMPYASVYLDEKFIGKTDNYGRRTLYPALQGSYNVKVNCPSGKLCDTQTVNVKKDVSASFKCDCTVPSGDLRVDVINPSGYPVANAYVFLDGIQTEEYPTNAFGYTYISAIPQGNHDVAILYNITNEINYGVYFQNKTVNLVSGINVLKFTADPRLAQKAASSSNATGSAIVPVIILAAAAEVVDVISIGLSTEDYCKCVYGADSGIKTCVSAIDACVTESDTRNCVGNVLNNAVDKTGNCKLEAAFLIGDVASPLVPVGIVGHFAVYAGKELKWVDKASDLGRVVFDKLEGVWKYSKKIGDNVVEYVAVIENKVVRKLLMLQTKFWKEEARLGLDMIAEKGGKEAAENFVYHLGLSRAEKVAAGITTINNKALGVNRWIKKLSTAKTADNVEGVAVEVEANLKHIGDRGGLKEVDRKLYRPDNSELTDLDGELGDGTIIAAKSGGGSLQTLRDEVAQTIRYIEDAKSQERYKNLGGLIFEFKYKLSNPIERSTFESEMNAKVASKEILSWGYLE